MPRNTTTNPAAHIDLGPAAINAAIERHESITQPRHALLWNYYRNPALSSPGAPRARLAQERGLPARLTGAPADQSAALRDDRAKLGREIVIENDIAWRIQTMVDFMFGRPITIVSTARDPAKRRSIERTLDAVWEASGGIGLLCDLGLLGHIHGHIDLLIRADAPTTDDSATPRDDDELFARARAIRIEPVDPSRGIPLLDPADYRRITGYIIRTSLVPLPACSEAGSADRTGSSTLLHRWLTRHSSPRTASNNKPETLTEVFSSTTRTLHLQRGDEAPTLIDSGPALVTSEQGPLPIVHIQNISQPFHYAGLSEVEPLIPLQNELNTRLSDRASRVTFQSFKMFLAKGLDGADKLPVGPGQVWSTDNTDAKIEAFGGDGASPSEDAHINEIREALDKASGVPPLASGVVRAKIGNLTSENALRITLMGLLSKTARKRVTYGRGLAQACSLILLALDRAGILHTDRADRNVRIEWPDPLPRDERDVLDAARAKLDLGIPRERILSELGYAPTDPGVT
ncbi:MAG: phage portal protein [Phycisphaerales bacterium]|nr:phage portal protein [Phycisphaerales bacterium]